METEAPSGKKKRSILWIIPIALAIVAGVLGWKAKSLLPQAGPEQAPAPVIAKIPPPPPMPSPTPESSSEPITYSQEKDLPGIEDGSAVAQSPESTTDPIAATEQLNEPELSEQPRHDEKPATRENQGDIAEEQPMPESVPTQASAGQHPDSKTETEQTQLEMTKTGDEKVSQTPSPQSTSPLQTEAASSNANPNITSQFTIQVGAFRNKSYATNKIANLTKKGYAPYILEITDTRERIWYAVRFGHYETRNQAAQALVAFKKKEKMDAIISRSDAI